MFSLRFHPTIKKLNYTSHDLCASENCLKLLSGCTCPIGLTKISKAGPLGGAVHGVALGEHGDHDVAHEGLSLVHLVHHLAHDLPGDRVHALCLPLLCPGVSTSQEILILDVKEMFRFSNRFNIGPKMDGSVRAINHALITYLNIITPFLRTWDLNGSPVNSIASKVGSFVVVHHEIVQE